MATQNNKRILHLKEWQMMCAAPSNSAAGAFVIKDPLGIKRTSLFVLSATVQYLYAVDQNSFLQLPSMALGGTFGAGSCGCWGGWSNALTATGGSTTTITLTTPINSLIEGATIRFLTGQNAGYEVKCTSAKIIQDGTTTINLASTLPYVVANNDTFKVDTGMYYVWNAGTMASGSFKSLDPLTRVVTSLSVTGAPASWGTDGKMCGTPSYVGYYSTGTVASSTNTSLTCTGKTWTADQWINYQVRIVSGKGIGQVRTITDNDATSLTVATWTVNPDSTSVFQIEANDDFLYLAGNNAITLYRYSISGNSWATLAPTTARNTAPNIGMSLNWIGKSEDTNWANESDILDGRYIFSFRGNATSAMDRYDISGGTAGAGAWKVMSYMGAQETFTTGSSYDVSKDKIYIKKDATNRLFMYIATSNAIYPFATDFYPDGTAVLGDKLFSVTYDDGLGGDDIEWLYYWMNTGTTVRRIMIF